MDTPARRTTITVVQNGLECNYRDSSARQCAKTAPSFQSEAACRRALTMGSPTRKRIEAILEAKLDQHPDLFPGADTAAPTASRAHGNVRGAQYFRATTETATPSTTEGDDDPCSSNPPSMH
jgi:hypothetical protein